MSTIINTTGHTTGITLTVADLALHLTTITPNPGIRQTAQALAEAINQGA